MLYVTGCQRASEHRDGDATVDVYKEALATLERRCAEGYSVMVVCRKFRQRTQLPDESIEQYATALRGLVITCNYGTMLDEVLRSQLVDKAFFLKYVIGFSWKDRCLRWTKLYRQRVMLSKAA